MYSYQQQPQTAYGQAAYPTTAIPARNLQVATASASSGAGGAWAGSKPSSLASTLVLDDVKKFQDDEFAEEDLDFADSTCDDPCYRSSAYWMMALVFFLVLGPFIIVSFDGLSRTQRGDFRRWNTIVDAGPSQVTGNATSPKKVFERLDNTKIGGAALAVIVGYGRVQSLQSALLAVIGWLLVFAGTFTASFIVTKDRSDTLIPDDFRQKGTISNVTQDAMTPHGRLWTTALGSASILLISSGYTYWIYRSWAPMVSPKENPLVSSVLQFTSEREWRTAWATIPYVGFLLTAMVPSLSGVHGYEMVLTAVHNVCAPLSMLFCVVMESVQLIYGENALAYFWTDAPTPIYGPLTTFQRLRVVILIECWIAGVVFVGVQAYLFFKPDNKRYWVALISYYGEVVGLSLAFAMPAIQGCEIIISGEKTGVIAEVKEMAISLLNLKQ